MYKYEYLSLLQIKNDMNSMIEILLKVSSKELSSIFHLNFMPFFSLILHESTVYIKTLNPEFEIPPSTSFSNEDVRLKTKMFDNSMSENFNIIRNIEYISKQDFKNKLVFKFTKNYNIGFWFDNKGHLIGNTQLNYFNYIDKNIKKKSLEMIIESYDKKAFDSLGNKHYEYAFYLGKMSKLIYNSLESLKDCTVVTFNDYDLHINEEDYNTYYDNFYFPKCEVERFLKLQLIHVLSQINSSIYLLNPIINSDGGFTTKIVYISCYYALRSIEKISNFILRKNQKFSFSNELDRIVKLKSNEIFKPEIRNYLMHYGFVDKKGNTIIEMEDCNVDKVYFGVIEKHYGNKDYIEFKNVLMCILTEISSILEKELNVNTLIR